MPHGTVVVTGASTGIGEAGVNISTAAVGRQSQSEDGRRGEVAVMAVMTDGEVPPEVVERIASSDGFLEGRAVNL